MAKIRRCIIAGITVLVHCTMYNYVIETNLDKPACAVYLNKYSVCWVKKILLPPTVHLPLAAFLEKILSNKGCVTPFEASKILI